MKIRTNAYQQEEIEGMTVTYPYVCHFVDLKTTYTPWHWHEELEFTCVLQGELNFYTQDGTFSLREGDVFFTNSNVLSRIENVSDCRIVSHIFNKVLLSGHYKSVFETMYMDPILLNRGVTALVLQGRTDTEKKIQKSVRNLSQLHGSAGEAFRVRNALSEIWLLLLDLLQETEQKPAASSVYQDRIMDMLAFIQEHYAEKLTLEQIAASASLSRRECIRTFQNSIHESPFEYLLDFRIKKAQNMLTAPETADLTITEIALQTGFSGSAYFGKIFRRLTGMTPREYRNRYAHTV
ncbi:MAG: AraC family transcriptional regulator [Eubacterium sp.]|nr:AraC family transcriptional regulator [Eubacterium sp.]